MADTIETTARITAADTGGVERLNIYKAGTYTVTTTLAGERSHTTATATTDEQLSLGDVGTGKFLYLTSDKAITVKIGGSDTARALALAAGKFLLMWVDVTSVYVSNASGATATIEYWVAG